MDKKLDYERRPPRILKARPIPVPPPRYAYDWIAVVLIVLSLAIIVILTAALTPQHGNEITEPPPRTTPDFQPRRQVQVEDSRGGLRGAPVAPPSIAEPGSR